jgi:hypothetical protein
MFCNNIYIGCKQLEVLINELSQYRDHIPSEIYEIKLGEFGSEYSNGGFLARLHFKSPGTLFISTHQQSEFEEILNYKVISEAKMYIVTEPILLDNFILELKELNSGASKEATLEGSISDNTRAGSC